MSEKTMRSAAELAKVGEHLRKSFEAARRRVDERLGGRVERATDLTPASAGQKLSQIRRNARRAFSHIARAGLPDTAPVTIHGLHTIDRLLSHVRHSVVRHCFYNLKALCPSLLDEYDGTVRAHVLENAGQLRAVHEELDSFFGAELPSGFRIGEIYREHEAATMRHLGKLANLCKGLDERIDSETARGVFAREAPPLIDDIMNALAEIQTDLDSRKISLAEVIDEAVLLASGAAKQAGVQVTVVSEPAPTVFGVKRALANVFAELMLNAVHYAGASRLKVMLTTAEDRCDAIVIVEDNGRGMSAEESEVCFRRGVSSSGTGEGLAMVVEIVEGEHLGHIELSTAPGEGCRFTIRIPVKYQTGKDGR